MTKYKVYISIDEKEYFWVIVENGKVINRNATREELEKITTKVRYYNKTNICPTCRKENNITDNSILYPKNTCHRIDKNGKDTEEWVCCNHRRRDHQRYNPNSQHNIIRSLANYRTGNQDPNHESTKADRSQELACKLYGWEDLNKKNDNNEVPIDCYDPNTGLLHQIKIESLEYDKGWFGWRFSHLEEEWHKNYEDITFFCMSEDGKIIEEIYKIPFKNEIKGKRKSVTISKSRLRNSKTLYWYEKYREKDEDELKKANKIWQEIINRD